LNKKTISAISTLIVIGIISGVVALIMLLIPNRYEISIQTSGVLGRLGDKDFSEQRNIYIDGVYTRSFFRQDTFSGRFIIDGFDFTADGSIVTLHADSNVGNGMLYVNLDKLRRGSYMDIHNAFGTMFFLPKFEYFTILIPEPTDNPALQVWNGATGEFISGPADNRSEALRVLYKLLKESLYYDSVIFR